VRVYTEKHSVGRKYRERLLKQLKAVAQEEWRKACDRRRVFFRPDESSVEAYERSLQPYREKLKAMLGWPLTLDVPSVKPRMRLKEIGRDDIGPICRVWIETLPGLEMYGLFFPAGHKGRSPLVITQHGACGTPELAASMYGEKNNYARMVIRSRKRGWAVFAPQLPMWSDKEGPKLDWQLGPQLNQTGGSAMALGVWQISRCLDALTKRTDVDASRIGMIGLSWGAHYTLMAAVLETRIKVALSSCFFNDRRGYMAHTTYGSNWASMFLDEELARMVCPRAFYVEVARKDTLFKPGPARPLARNVAQAYRRLGIGDRFRFKETNLGHEFDRDDDGMDFVEKWLG
jgi:dienelactone hydrolase